jgi:hypothetical protein
MKTRSAKNKGKRLQNDVRDIILENYKQLEPDDVASTIMGEQGTDIKLSPAARKIFPFSIECKNQENISVWACLKQAEDNCKPETYPMLIFKRNRSDAYVTLKFDDFMKIFNKPSE